MKFKPIYYAYASIIVFFTALFLIPFWSNQNDAKILFYITGILYISFELLALGIVHKTEEKIEKLKDTIEKLKKEVAK